AGIAGTEAETDDGRLKDNLGSYDYGGAKFNMMTFENQNFHYRTICEEQTGASLDDAMYKATMNVEERFNVDLTETLYPDGQTPKAAVLAGDDTFDLVRIRCTDATTWWSDGLLIPADEVPVIDISQPYWDKTVNDSLTIAKQHYVALSSFDLCEYDLTFSLMFNKGFITDYSFDNPYDMVKTGIWTMDRMNGMMKAFSKDLNGDGAMDKEDQWGYTSHPKMVSPGFWIGADALSIEKDADDIPHLNCGSDKFIAVWEKIIDICYSDNQYLGFDESADIPPSCREMFSSNRALFMDMSFFFSEDLRSMDSDFGIIPYPKYDENQDHYSCRLCYYMPTVVPSSLSGDRLERCGVMLEALACAYYNDVIPAYYDIVLQNKVARDVESQEMLDIIFTSRVIDIGDSTLCGDLRDGPLCSMFKTKKTDMASRAEKLVKSINKKLNQLPGVEL
ncbi:MAG: hypothetical protein K6D94_07930, partial [Clostridiales bacterium]|nr:hypothetical protein [Clostridiales bacterium]